jgi:hypothetical protein
MHGMVCGVPFGCRTILLLCNSSVLLVLYINDYDTYECATLCVGRFTFSPITSTDHIISIQNHNKERAIVEQR